MVVTIFFIENCKKYSCEKYSEKYFYGKPYTVIFWKTRFAKVDFAIVENTIQLFISWIDQRDFLAIKNQKNYNIYFT